MKKNSAIVLSIIGALAVIAAINPIMRASAQEEGNTLEATQSNSFTAFIDQSAQTGGETGEVTGGETGGDISQGFCFSVNQQNSAAGNVAANEGFNEINCP